MIAHGCVVPPGRWIETSTVQQGEYHGKLGLGSVDGDHGEQLRWES